MKKIIVLLCMVVMFITPSFANGEEINQEQLNKDRMALYKKGETLTFIPWYYFAAIDTYERNVRSVRRDIPKRENGVLSIYIKPEDWSGMSNPVKEDTYSPTIHLFGGIGMDGNNDGKASIQDDEDLLYTFIHRLNFYGQSRKYIRMMLWDYYQRAITVDIIDEYARLYQYFGKLNIEGNAFPLPIHSTHSYRSTWGAPRSFGGRRVHEGTDIFANYGTPVRSTCYGIIETKGWNRIGGWRIGIRDLNNNYHYYAHLGGFNKDIQQGQVVEPGTLIGYVGSTGYGPPGTSGKFPPHLHYGIYKDNGYAEWSYDPYPRLRLWERQDRIALNKK
ncbi:M23 family metallopeptidase [Gottfriedia luciferensis]|uniref:M23 family metallopeptidase n=1 Tax=Gottfriedia luciferensis TaxID=178774 RepID=UPI000B453A5F|nr:M23 family metallopeptidase [Gottfriedia luciferensis]